MCWCVLERYVNVWISNAAEPKANNDRDLRYNFWFDFRRMQKEDCDQDKLAIHVQLCGWTSTVLPDKPTEDIESEIGCQTDDEDACRAAYQGRIVDHCEPGDDNDHSQQRTEEMCNVGVDFLRVDRRRRRISRRHLRVDDRVVLDSERRQRCVVVQDSAAEDQPHSPPFSHEVRKRTPANSRGNKTKHLVNNLTNVSYSEILPFP